MNELETAFQNVVSAIKQGNKSGLFELEQSGSLLSNLQTISRALFHQRANEPDKPSDSKEDK